LTTGGETGDVLAQAVSSAASSGSVSSQGRGSGACFILDGLQFLDPVLLYPPRLSLCRPSGVCVALALLGLSDLQLCDRSVGDDAASGPSSERTRQNARHGDNGDEVGGRQGDHGCGLSTAFWATLPAM
jgi:hypothetical protein